MTTSKEATTKFAQDVERLRAIETAAVRLNRLSTPYTAYERWRASGDTQAADKLQEWDDARLALKEAVMS
jgi:hypothetical protein